MKLREQRLMGAQQQGGAVSILELLEKEMEAEEQKGKQKDEGAETSTVSSSAVTGQSKRTKGQEVGDEMEKELQKEEEIRLCHEQSCLVEQLENSSVTQFDAELHQLYEQKLHLDIQLKLMEMQMLKLQQEVLVLKRFETREEKLQEKLSKCLQEENQVLLKLEECNQQLELKGAEMIDLKKRVRALTDAFQASLGENCPFEEFLTKVFTQKIKRVQMEKSPLHEEDGEEDSDDDLDSDDYSSKKKREASLNVRPKGCKPELLKSTLQLRHDRVELEELQVKERKVVEALKKDITSLQEKEKLVKSQRRAVEADIELMNQEKQQEMNEVEVIIPLKLNQIQLACKGPVLSDLSEFLALDKMELFRMDEQIQQLQADNKKLNDQFHRDLKKRDRLLRDKKVKSIKVNELENRCDELMMRRFGRKVDLEALLTMPDSTRLEELEQEKIRLLAAHSDKMKHLETQVDEAQTALMKETRRNSNLLHTTIDLLEQTKDLKAKISSREKTKDKQPYLDHRRRQNQERIQELQVLVKRQRQQVDALKQEICLLSSAGGPVLPPLKTPNSPIPSAHAIRENTSKQTP
ncbi:transcript variant X2 [Nothobranchius furzeri]|uniref:Transcript variant X2 n=1 Tax=Nothobranchius furzeri TaxID=105023 RepID=A0A9D3BR95_NOTFU|nr:transcript variant X2 [Nothobranchius furzeri]